MTDKKTLMEMVRKIGGVQQLKEGGRMAEVDSILRDVASGDVNVRTLMSNPKTPEEKAAVAYLKKDCEKIAKEKGLDCDDDAVIKAVRSKMRDQYTNESVRAHSKDVLEALRAAGMHEAVRVAGKVGGPYAKTMRYHNDGTEQDPEKQAHRDATARMVKQDRARGVRVAPNSSSDVATDAHGRTTDGYSRYDDSRFGRQLKRRLPEEVSTAMRQAGIQLNERWDDDGYDDDEDRDVKIAMSDKRQQAFEKRAKKVVGKVDPDKDISKMAKNNSKKDDDEEEKPAAKAAPANKAAPAEKKPAPAAEKKEDAPAKPARGSFTAIVKPMLARGASTADIRAALTKAGVSTNHLHSRLHGLRKGLKEGFVLVHPHMPSFVLAENLMMNQYQWISEKDDATSLQPMLFASEAEAQRVIKYMVDFKNQQAVLTKVQLGD